MFVAGCGDSLGLGGSGGSGSMSSTSGSGPGTGSGGAHESGGLPCDVDAVLAQHCRQCHTSPPQYGAPMPLVTWDDTQAPAKSDATKRVVDLMKVRINATNSPMPPSADLPDADKATLNAWIDAGAKKGTEPTCGSSGSGGSGPAVGPEALPCKATNEFVAHAAGSMTPYHVPETGAENEYECFTFKSPFDGTEQGTAWAPIIGDKRVLHHWILFRSQTPQTDGGVGPCNMPSDATFVAGWAPGGTNYVLPSDVGLELGGGDWMILQVHYHNLSHYADADDASGVAFCTTETPRTHEAGIMTLGTINVNIPSYSQGTQAVGLCSGGLTKFLPEPLTIIATFPHMHTLGTAIKTDILRGGDNGPPESVVDVKHFSFDDQHYYENDPPVMFNPGDGARTTCTYDNPSPSSVHFGEKTEDEMCFDFMLLYPINIFKPGNRTCGIL